MSPVWALLPPIEFSEPLHWELLEQPVLPILAEPPAPKLQPITADEIDAVINNTPLEPADYITLLRLSPTVPTTNTLPPNQWRVQFSYISPFDSGAAGSTGDQINYSINLDLGLVRKPAAVYLCNSGQ